MIMENAHLTDRFYELSVKRLSSEISKAESEELNNYLKEAKTLEAYLEMEKSWNEITVPANNIFDSNRAFSRLEQRIEAWEARQNRFSLTRIAASIALLIGLGVGSWFTYNQLFTDKMELVQTATGERNTIHLSDGTLVELNVNSFLEYPSDFKGDERSVILKGEAYFKVARDKSKPFKVSTNDITTTVLGTQFNIRSYPEDSLIAVSLLEGSVKVESRSGTAVLEPLEQATINMKENKFEIAPFDSLATVAWLSNTLLFKNTTMRKIALELKRVYGLDIVFEDSALARLTVSGRFKNEKPTLILTAITRANKLDYRKIDEQKIEIYKPDRNKQE